MFWLRFQVTTLYYLMNITERINGGNIASIYRAENESGNFVEFVESTQPPLSIKEKWLIIVSALFGCPVNCSFCKAGGKYKGPLSKKDLFFQTDFLIDQRFSNRTVTSELFELRFARMGEPSYNINIISFLREFPARYTCNKLIPSLASIAPSANEEFFEELLQVKKVLYPDTFRLRFSLHSTDIRQRNSILPVSKMDFAEIAGYGERFFDLKGEKVILFFPITHESLISVEVLGQYFDPEIFKIKINPVNPSIKSIMKGAEKAVMMTSQNPFLLKDLKEVGYDVELSFSEWEENEVGINCRQFANTFNETLEKTVDAKNSY